MACEKRRAEAGRAGVVGQQHDVAGRGQQMIVPAQEEVIAPHGVRTAVHQHQQWIFLRRIEAGRAHDHVVNAGAAFVSNQKCSTGAMSSAATFSSVKRVSAW